MQAHGRTSPPWRSFPRSHRKVRGVLPPCTNSFDALRRASNKRALFSSMTTEAYRRNAEEMIGAERPRLTYGVTRPRSMHRITSLLAASQMAVLKAGAAMISSTASRQEQLPAAPPDPQWYHAR
jgi:hypothetical protein